MSAGPSLVSYKADRFALTVCINRAILAIPEPDVWGWQDLPMLKAIKARPVLGHITKLHCFQKAKEKQLIDATDALIGSFPAWTGLPNWSAPKVVAAVLSHEPWKPMPIKLFGFDMAGTQYFDGTQWYDGSLGTPVRSKTRLNGQLNQKAAKRWEEERDLLRPLLADSRVKKC